MKVHPSSSFNAAYCLQFQEKQRHSESRGPDGLGLPKPKDQYQFQASLNFSEVVPEYLHALDIF